MRPTSTRSNNKASPDAKHMVPELEAKVLSWTIDDITTANLFAKQVSTNVHFEFVLVCMGIYLAHFL
jgi:hypothetical protein